MTDSSAHATAAGADQIRIAIFNASRLPSGERSDLCEGRAMTVGLVYTDSTPGPAVTSVPVMSSIQVRPLVA